MPIPASLLMKMASFNAKCRATAKEPYFCRLPPKLEEDLGPVAVELSSDQAQVYEKILSWRQRRDSFMTFGGYAGTGKTTVIAELSKELSGTVAFVTYTGKASGVLTKKLRQAGSRYSCSTIHSLIYEPVEDPTTGRVIRWERKPKIEADIIVIDEASMVNDEMLLDLKSYRVPILAVGDHGQLPPIQGKGVLMGQLDAKLEQIHRQAEGSPIIRLSRDVREQGHIPSDLDTDEFVQVLDQQAAMEKLQDLYAAGETDIGIITYTNRSRQFYNGIARQLWLKEEPPPHPVVGDRMVCLRNTEHIMFNGMIGTITEPALDNNYWWNTSVTFEDERFSVRGELLKTQLGRDRTYGSWTEISIDLHELKKPPLDVRRWQDVGLLFDYGYALTCHKFQGSQAKHVFLLHEQSNMMSHDEWRRWLYTGITRATQHLYVMVP